MFASNQSLSSLLDFKLHSLRWEIESFIYGNFSRVPVLEVKIKGKQEPEYHTVSVSFLNKNNIASQIEQLFHNHNIPLSNSILKIRILFHDTIPCSEHVFFEQA